MDGPTTVPGLPPPSESVYDSQEETEYYDEEEEHEIKAEVSHALSASKEKIVTTEQLDEVNPALKQKPI
jgi:hypothetical protein